MSYLQLNQVRKSFADVQVIRDIDLDIAKGELVVIVGPSGCGKSTLLRLISGLEEITSGDLIINGQRVNDLPPAKRGISMVFQSYALYPHMTTFDNMAFGMQLAKRDKKAIEKSVHRTAKLLQLDDLLDRLPRHLSGGQRQRVAIGRAIVRNQPILLLDEPLSNLDAMLRLQTRFEIGRLHKILGMTTIYVTHDQVEAMTMADRIVILCEGRVVQVGDPMSLYRRPKNLFVAKFIGSPQMNVICASASIIDEKTLKSIFSSCRNINFSTDQFCGVDVVTYIGVRPEHMRICSANEEASIVGEIKLIEQLGEFGFYHVQLKDGQIIIVRFFGEITISVGENVAVDFDLKHVHLFDKNEERIA